MAHGAGTARKAAPCFHGCNSVAPWRPRWVLTGKSREARKPCALLGLYDRSRAELCGLQASSWGALRGGQWLALRLQLLAASLVAAVALLAVLDAAGRLPWAAPAGGAGAGLVGLSLSYALPITGLLNGLLTSAAETEQVRLFGAGKQAAMQRIDDLEWLATDLCVCQ